MTVGVIGYGWVGRAVFNLFSSVGISCQVYDPFLSGPDLPRNICTREALNTCDVAFICVPTPNRDDGALNMAAIEESVAWCTCPLLVIRSTLQPGTADYLAHKYSKNIVVQPEYLGETPAHPFLDMSTRPFLIIGGEPKDRRKLIDIYTKVYNANVTIRQVSALEAEIIKLSENRAIAFKVAQCQELYDVCQRAGVDYYTVRDAVYGDDPRFNLWWTFIYPDARGMNSKCIPKDVLAWKSWAESLTYRPVITNALLDKNKEWVNGI